MKEMVIKIDEAIYHRIISGFANEDDVGLFADLFKNGKVLPPGHGDLIDRNLALSDDGLCEFHMYDDYVKMRNYLKSIPTIIKTDKEYEVEVVTSGNCMMCGKELTEYEEIFFCKSCEDKAKKEGNNHGEKKLS